MKLPGFNQDVLHPEDRRLASRMIKGDEKAISEFMDIYFPRLFRFALIRLDNNAANAEDVVQQALTIAARRIVTYRGEASLMTWLAQICKRELSRFTVKSAARNNVISLFDDEPLASAFLDTLESDDRDRPLEFTEKAELIVLVHLVLDQLPNRQGDFLEWKYIEGLSIVEISQRLNMGTEAVQSQLARAKKTFKRAFTDLYELHYRDT